MYFECSVSIPDFVSTPTSVNATLASTAIFSCSATTGIIVWIVNGSPLTQLNTSDIGTIDNGRILSVKAEEEYDNINVICAILTLDHRQPEDQFSGPAVLRVQGMKTVLIPCNTIVVIC